MAAKGTRVDTRFFCTGRRLYRQKHADFKSTSLRLNAPCRLSPHLVLSARHLSGSFDQQRVSSRLPRTSAALTIACISAGSSKLSETSSNSPSGVRSTASNSRRTMPSISLASRRGLSEGRSPTARYRPSTCPCAWRRRSCPGCVRPSPPARTARTIAGRQGEPTHRL